MAAADAVAPLLLVGNFLSGSRAYRLACEDLAMHLSAKGWPLLRTSERPGRVARLVDMLGSAWRWRDRYEAAQVDVFSGAAFLWAWLTCWVLRRAGKPYVLTLRGGNLPSFAARFPRAVRTLLSSAFAVTVPSRYLLERMSAYGSGLLLIPNAIEVSAYALRTPGPLRPSLVWLRAFHEIYDPALAVDVLARVADEFPEATLTMIGPDKGDGSMERTRRRAAERGMTDRLKIVPGVAKDAVPAALAAGDIFLNTTGVDNTPVSVMEAMACGLVVVSTNVGGIPALLDDGEDALLVPPADAQRMAAAVGRLLREDGLAQRLRAHARSKVEGFDWSRVLPEWERLLRAAARAAV